MDIVGPIFWLIVALGLLITFHEYGHFWVARRMGVRVLRFSVGFGSALFSRTARDGTEYRIAAIPLGGYVKMLDENEGPVPADQLRQAFNRQPVSRRIAIVAAGPAFNLIFALAAFWLMFLIGIAETRPIVGEPQGLAAAAGIQAEDRIVRVDRAEVQTWSHTLLALIGPALDRRAVVVEVEDTDGRRRELRLALDQLGDNFNEERTLEHLGLTPWQPRLAPIIGEVSPNTPAERAGLRSGDRISGIDGQTVSDWQAIARLIPERAVDEDGRMRELLIEIERDGQLLRRELRAERDEGRPVIGIRPPPPDPALQRQFERNFTILRLGPIEALLESVRETGRLSSATLGILARMITGQASLSNLSGPITIARMADSSARLGFSRFLFFLGLISLSLAIINLLPIPILDGGHLMYYLVELIKGSPVSETTQQMGQYLGLVVIVGLMSLAIFNDIVRVFT